MVFSMDHVAQQSGKLAVVTGANTGIGYEIARAMAKKGLRVVMACRSVGRAEEAKQRILAEAPSAELDVLPLDLSKMASVRSAAETFRSQYDSLDILVNNAGVYFLPFSKTEDGFETTIASNSLGHFLFTSLLIDLIPDSAQSRITWVGSDLHKKGQINLKNIHLDDEYDEMKAYRQSKLACLMYAFELDRKLKAANKKIISNSAHPGISLTDMSRNMPKLMFLLMKYTFLQFIAHPPEDAALPILQAALDQASEGGQYYGPTGFREVKGPPGIATIAEQAKDLEVAKKLWALSEKLTSTAYNL